MGNIAWNDNVKLIISDVDETIADLYLDADPALIRELELLLREGRVLVLVSGQGINNIEKRVVHHVDAMLRKRILVGHCSGAELWGYDVSGRRQTQPYYSYSDERLSPHNKTKWRQVTEMLCQEFKLKIFPTMPIRNFYSIAGEDPFAIMFEDRGPQITFEVVNGYNISPENRKQIHRKTGIFLDDNDLRLSILERANNMFEEEDLPVTARLAGVFAIDFAIKGISKKTSIKYLLESEQLLHELDLTTSIIADSNSVEVWGDKFSITQGGTDRHMSEALPMNVRSITFRDEDPQDFLPHYNIVVWNGQAHLHKGLLEFLCSRSM